jgi:hypothetical protein
MSKVSLRPATLDDVPVLDRWDHEPHVIAATSDDPEAEKAFEDAYWPDEVAMQDEFYQSSIRTMRKRTIGATSNRTCAPSTSGSAMRRTTATAMAKR